MQGAIGEHLAVLVGFERRAELESEDVVGGALDEEGRIESLAGANLFRGQQPCPASLDDEVTSLNERTSTWGRLAASTTLIYKVIQIKIL